MPRPRIFPPGTQVNIRLPLHMAVALREAAAERDQKVPELVRDLLIKIMNDDLFSAVLDDD